MKAFDIGIKFIDPFVKTHSLKENDNVAMDIAAKQWNYVAEQTGAAIDLIIHTRKLGGGDEVTVEDGRARKVERFWNPLSCRPLFFNTGCDGRGVRAVAQPRQPPPRPERMAARRRA
jgi:hypothetical protein